MCNLCSTCTTCRWNECFCTWLQVYSIILDTVRVLQSVCMYDVRMCAFYNSTRTCSSVRVVLYGTIHHLFVPFTFFPFFVPPAPFCTAASTVDCCSPPPFSHFFHSLPWIVGNHCTLFLALPKIPPRHPVGVASFHFPFHNKPPLAILATLCTCLSFDPIHPRSNRLLLVATLPI